MNIVVCVNESGNFVSFSKLLARPKTLDFVFNLFQNKILLCNEQDVKLLKLSPCAKMIVKDQNFKQKLPDFLTPQKEFGQNETVATTDQLCHLASRLNPERTFVAGSLAEEILKSPFKILNATKIYLVTLLSTLNMTVPQNIFPATYKKTKTHEPIIDGSNLDYVSEYVLKTQNPRHSFDN